MIKTITKIGNSQGIILDVAIMELAHLKVGNEVNLTLHGAGSLMITPTRPVITPEAGLASASAWIDSNSELFSRLSK